MNEKDKKEVAQYKKDMWNAAIDTVIAEFRIAPPSRIGEAAFLRRLVLMKTMYDQSH